MVPVSVLYEVITRSIVSKMGGYGSVIPWWVEEYQYVDDRKKKKNKKKFSSFLSENTVKKPV